MEVTSYRELNAVLEHDLDFIDDDDVHRSISFHVS